MIAWPLQLAGGRTCAAEAAPEGLEGTVAQRASGRRWPLDAHAGTIAQGRLMDQQPPTSWARPAALPLRGSGPSPQAHVYSSTLHSNAASTQ